MAWFKHDNSVKVLLASSAGSFNLSWKVEGWQALTESDRNFFQYAVMTSKRVVSSSDVRSLNSVEEFELAHEI